MNMIKINKIAIKRTTPKPMTTLELDLVAALVGTTVLDVLDVVLMVDPYVFDVVLMVDPVVRVVVLMVDPDVFDVVLMVDPVVLDVVLMVDPDVFDVVLMVDPFPVQTNKQINLIISLPPPLARQHGASTAAYCLSKPPLQMSPPILRYLNE